MKSCFLAFILLTLPHGLFSQSFRHSLFVAPNYSGHHFSKSPSPELNRFFDKSVNSSLGYSFGYRADKNTYGRTSFGFGVEYVFSKDAEYLTTSGDYHPYFWDIPKPSSGGTVFMTHQLRYQYISLPASFTMKFKQAQSGYFYLRTELGITFFVQGKMNSRSEIRWEDGTNTLTSEMQKDFRMFSKGIGLPASFYGNIALGRSFNIAGRAFYGELSYSHDISATYRDENLPILSTVRRRILTLNIGVQLNKASSD